LGGFGSTKNGTKNGTKTGTLRMANGLELGIHRSRGRLDCAECETRGVASGLGSFISRRV